LIMILTMSYARGEYNFSSHSSWYTVNTMQQTIQPLKFFAYGYSPLALAVRWEVACSFACDVYLFTKPEQDKFESGQSFYYLAKNSSITSTYGDFNDSTILPQALSLLVANPSTSKLLTANFNLKNFLQATDFSGAIIGSIIAFLFLLGFFCCAAAVIVILVRHKLTYGYFFGSWKTWIPNEDGEYKAPVVPSLSNVDSHSDLSNLGLVKIQADYTQTENSTPR
jgi:hypothetical protein